MNYFKIVFYGLCVIFSAAVFLIGYDVGLRMPLTIMLFLYVVAYVDVLSRPELFFAKFVYLSALLASSLPLFDLYFYDFIKISNVYRASEGFTTDFSIQKVVVALHLLTTSSYMLGVNLSSSSVRVRCAPANGMAVLTFLQAVILIVPMTLFYCLVIPKGTIFQDNYLTVRVQSGIITGFYFAGFTSIMFVGFGLALLDAFRTASSKIRKEKFALITICSLILVFYADLLRGNRDTANLFLVLFGLTLAFWSIGPMRVGRGAALLRLFLCTLPVGALFLVVQFARTSLSVDSFSIVSVISQGWNLVRSGTWMGALFSSFGVSSDIVSGRFHYPNFWPLRDFILSTPPSPITRILGINRPYDDHLNTPAGWYHFISNGGGHLSTFPYYVLGPVGVIIFMAGMGWFIGKVESKVDLNSMLSVLLYCSVLECALRWSWYSNMYPVRSLMAALLWCIFYRVIINLGFVRLQSRRL